MNNKQISVLVLLYILFTSIFIKGRISEYQSWKKYNGMKGIVIDVYENSGRYSSSLYPTIRLEDGTVKQIEGNHKNWKVGDTFINEIPYNMILGEGDCWKTINPNRFVAWEVYSLVYVGIHIIVIIAVLLVSILFWFDNLGKKDSEKDL